jgi:hypothetical protein
LGWRLRSKCTEGAITWFVFEKQRYRLSKSLSDLDGSDPYIHDGTIRGVWRELNNAFVRRDQQPTAREMHRLYTTLQRAKPPILAASGAATVFAARPFRELVLLGRRVADDSR